jgi:hypothetical protein
VIALQVVIERDAFGKPSAFRIMIESIFNEGECLFKACTVQNGTE